MDKLINAKYFTVNETESFKFLRTPKALLSEKYKKLSFGAKFLYALLFDRTMLSKENEWIDTEGKIYIYYARNSIADDMNISTNTATKFMQELIKYQLIEEVRQGLGKPNRIYVLKFIIHESTIESQTPKISDSGNVNLGSQESKNLSPNNTNINNTKLNNTTSTPQKDVDVDSQNLNLIINETKIKIDSKLNSSINIKQVANLVNKADIKTIQYYLDNWNKFDCISKNNPVGFFIKAVLDKYAIPERKEATWKKKDVVQESNYEQRTYDDDYFNSLYDNVADEKTIELNNHNNDLGKGLNLDKFILERDIE